jgi:peptidoglycan hydrolase-like protein with peptidoglycan-binding domain
LFKRDLSLGDEGEDVKLLQDSLRGLDLYSAESTGIFDEATRQAVYDFQIMKDIVSSWDDLGAGYCGVQTRAMLELELSGKKTTNTKAAINPKDVFFAQTLKRGDSGEDVIILQNELYKLGFLRVAPSGVFDELTEHAVFKFQQKKGILKEKSELGAGVVGPQTRVAMNLVFSDRKRMIAQIKPRNQVQLARAETVSTTSELAFDADLNFGDSSSSVGLLQSKLKELGYFQGEVTNFFGEQTHQALVSFQLDRNIIGSESDLGAGRVGPKTREVLNQA